jgi:hypothetical protein
MSAFRHLGHRPASIAILLVALLGYSSALWTQPAKLPPLGEILDRLEANLNRYDTRLPSLFCDEHVLSSQMEPGMRNQPNITDSVFRLKRTPRPDHTTSFAESREVQSVDGKPPAAQNVYAPTTLSGAFEGGLAVVSRSQSACMRYALQRPKEDRPHDPYVVRFTTVLTPQNTANCLLQENSKGEVLIDPESVQITHLEITTPRHIIIPGGPFRSPVVGKRVITADYSPVLLGGETFWMPSAISMRNISGSGTFHMMVWSFQATYRNYHLLEVTSRILPGNVTTPAP